MLAASSYPASLKARVGGRFKVRFRMLGGSEHESTGKFLEIVPSERVTMTWQWSGEDADPESRIEIVLRAIGDGTELTFTHAQLPDAKTRDGGTEIAGNRSDEVPMPARRAPYRHSQSWRRT